MIRLSLLALYIAGASAYAFKDWYKSLCALILLLAVVEHPDMPKTMFGIQGLNPWNLLLVAVVAGWLRARSEERLTWNMPRHINVLLLAYLGVILLGFARMIASPDLLDASVASLVSEKLINSIKWVVPGLLLFDGCRSRDRLLMGLAAVLGVYFLLGVQVIKWMPLGYAISGDALSERSLKILVNEIGYHRVNISAMLAGASWAIFATRPLGLERRHRVALVLAAGSVVYAQALTAGRAGYVTWAAIGFLLCAARWRRYLLVAPVAVVAVLIVAPGVAQRMLEGFTAESRDTNLRLEAAEARNLGANQDAVGPDAYTITAGRTVIWPYVVEKIGEAPLFGYGREAMVRTGLTGFLALRLGEAFGHPHNAYLELLLDNGLVGFIIIIPFYLIVLKRSLSLFVDSRHPAFTAVGGATLAIVLSLLIAGLASQTFYPREGWMPMWCLIGLMLRVSVERPRWKSAGISTEPAIAAAPVRPGSRFAVRKGGQSHFSKDSAKKTVTVSLSAPLHRTPRAHARPGRLRPLHRAQPERPTLFDLPEPAHNDAGALRVPKYHAAGRRFRRE